MADPTPAEIYRVRRLAVGNSTDTATLADADIIALWAEEGAGSVYLTAAEACDMLANGAARHFTWSADGQSMNMAQRQRQYRDNAASLRSRYYGSGSMTLTRAEDVGDTDTEYTA